MFEQFINQLAWLSHVSQFCSHHNIWLSFITNLFSRRAVLKENLQTKLWPTRAEQDQPQRDYAHRHWHITAVCGCPDQAWWEVQGRVTQTALDKVTRFSQAHQLLLAPGLPAKGVSRCDSAVIMSSWGNREGAGPALSIELDQKVSLKAKVN